MSQALSPADVIRKLESWLRRVNEPDRVFTKNKKVEVVFLVEAVNAILPRTEGVEDITLIKMPGTEYEVPAVLPEKLQAVARRNMLSFLRSHYERRTKEVDDYLQKLSVVFKPAGEKGGKKDEAVGYIKATESLQTGRWNCFVQPPAGEGTDVGMDGFCPACALFGTVLDDTKVSGIDNISVGLKSRVEFDPAIAVSDRKVSVIPLTHNKVSDGVSWTGQSLFTEYHVAPGTIFVGKATLEDVTEQELLAFLATLLTITRLGGRERLFGGVRVHLVGVRGGSYETVSALELARELARNYGERLPSVEEVLDYLKKELQSRGFLTDLNQEAFRKLAESDETWSSLWRSTLIFDKQVLLRVIQLQGKEGYQEAWSDKDVLGGKP